MSISTSAISSGLVMYSNTLPTTSTTLYTSQANSTNVPAPYATAYIKEILVANTTSSAITVTITVNGRAVFPTVTVAGNDSKILSGLNTMMSGNTTIVGYASATGIDCTISGTEVL